MGLGALARRSGSVALALALLALAVNAHAEVHARGEKEDPPSDSLGFVVSPGAMLAWAGSHGLRFDGELSATLYGWDHFGIGVATGGNPTRFYAELQPVALFDLPHSAGSDAGLFIGINPGVVVDWSGPTTRTGGQVTAWTWFMYVCCHGFLPFPFVPFARLEVFPDEHVVSAGLMLKFGFPVPRGHDG
jgi:hypothetical protein